MKNLLTLVLLIVTAFTLESRPTAIHRDLITITVYTENCLSNPIDSVSIKLIQKDSPYQTWTSLSDTVGFVQFDTIPTGTYDIVAFKRGCQESELQNISITSNYTTHITLDRKLYKVRNLHVDSLTSEVTWDKPLITALNTDFEAATFPPENWQIETDGEGWYQSSISDSLFNNWTIPAWPGQYAIVNHDYSTQGGSYDYLITSEIDVRVSNQLKLCFDSYYDSLYGGTAKVEYSADNGATWQLLKQLSPDTIWQKDTVDLSPITQSGIENIKIRFNFTAGNGPLYDGWAIDNVNIHGEEAWYEGFELYFNNNFFDSLPHDQFSYFLNDLIYGTSYTASLKATGECTMSEEVLYQWISRYLYPPRNAHENYTYNTSVVSFLWLPPQKCDTTCHVPYGLLSYNIFRNGALISNTPYNNEPDTSEYVYTDPFVMPGTYYYQATALYDLAQFGYPGEIGESMITPVDTITVIWGYDLPFSENWDLGSFNFNNWTIETNNWIINSTSGDNAPSAQFINTPHLTNDYESCLTSSPIKADSITEGEIWLDGNLKLDDLNETGEEHLVVEVYNGEQWYQVYDVANHGSFDFDEGQIHLNISDYTKGKVFQIRFKATGQNSADINSWFIDNINIYRTCDAPSDFTGEYFWEGPGANGYGVQLEWEAPTMPMGPRWIFWGYGENSSAIGLADGGDFSVAARWDSNQIAEYVGGSITKMEIYIQDTDYSNLILKVWKGAEASSLVYSEDVTSSIVANTFNEFTLSSPVLIEEGDEIWVGYTILGQAFGVCPAGTDAGPAFTGNGDKITTDGVTWENLSDFGYDMNWNIAMHIETIYFNSSRSQTKTDGTVYTTPGATLSLSEMNPSPVKMKTGNSKEFSGFTIYRSETGNKGDYVPYKTVPYKEGTTHYNLKDMYPNVNSQQTYWYKVSANWTSDLDNCESGFANSQLNPEEDFVEIFVTGVNELQAGSVTLYPNPATNSITITSTRGIEKLTVFNATGQMVEQISLGNKQQIVLNTSKYKAGVYHAKIETGSITNSEKIVKRFVVVK
ncbi:MAG: hypothetical protein DRJ09_01050 [Bacteroidetes bacterium]|nr:MAG: hypothetical protein DRJ09_01050 [Bacteroidota bacterium]